MNVYTNAQIAAMTVSQYQETFNISSTSVRSARQAIDRAKEGDPSALFEKRGNKSDGNKGSNKPVATALDGFGDLSLTSYLKSACYKAGLPADAAGVCRGFEEGIKSFTDTVTALINANLVTKEQIDKIKAFVGVRSAEEIRGERAKELAANIKKRFILARDLNASIARLEKEGLRITRPDWIVNALSLDLNKVSHAEEAADVVTLSDMMAGVSPGVMANVSVLESFPESGFDYFAMMINGNTTIDDYGTEVMVP